MASRNLTSLFVQLRERNRGLIAPPTHSFAVAGEGKQRLLNSPTAEDIEMPSVKLPPVWVDLVDNIKTDLQRIHTEMNTLKKLHADRLKVTFATDEAAQDHKIDAVAEEITMLFKRCEARVKQIALKGNDGHNLSREETVVRLNVMRGMADKIRSQSKAFRTMQRDFLVKLQKRDDTGKEFFFGDDEQHQGITIEDIMDGSLSQERMQEMEDIKKQMSERGQEIIKIAQSINELATMFRELSILIVEQGSILDRIDYNIEQASVKVKKGKSELVKADEYSKAASKRSLFCIAILLVGIIICVTILVLRVKSKK